MSNPTPSATTKTLEEIIDLVRAWERLRVLPPRTVEHLYSTPQLSPAEALAAIDNYTKEAVIKELENLADQYCEVRDETMGTPIDLKAVTLYRIKHRINTLKGGIDE